MDAENYGCMVRTDSEAGVVMTLIIHPEFIFRSESLRPEHFMDQVNSIMYKTIKNLTSKGIFTMDTYNIIQELKSAGDDKQVTDQLVVTFIENSELLCRNTIEEYLECVHSVMDASFRRTALKMLKKCVGMCPSESVENIQQAIVSTLDAVLSDYSATEVVPELKDVVDNCWAEIQARQTDEFAGYPFKINLLNRYCSIERGEMIVLGAGAKVGKSMFLLNEAVHLAKMGLKILYVDSELGDRLFTARLISHLTGIEYRRLITGDYDDEMEAEINYRIQEIKEWNFSHCYMTEFSEDELFYTINKVYRTTGIDVIFVDYLKGNLGTDAYEVYALMGKLTDMLKNKVCGVLNVACVAACQTTDSGKPADSAKIVRNASTFMTLAFKTKDEIEECPEAGNRKLRIVNNRNGVQMSDDSEWIDLVFDGNRILFEQAPVQHTPSVPY